MAHKILSHEEIMELIKQHQAGDENAMEELMEHNTRLIWSAVQRFKGQSYEDLFQIGAIGFMKAVDKFNFDFDVKFSTYAVPMIIGEIQRFLRDDGTVKVPRAIKDLAVKIVREQLVGRTLEEISELLEVEDLDLIKTTLEYIKNGRGSTMSIDEKVYESDGNSDILLKDQLEGDVNSNWFDRLAIRQAIENLDDERDRLIVHLRYFKDMSQGEVAERLGISQVQVSRLEKKILLKLKDLYENKEEDTMARGVQPKGNREAAIKLLQTTEMNHKEISKITGVPIGSMGKLSKEYRPKEISRKKKEIALVNAREALQKSKQNPNQLTMTTDKPKGTVTTMEEANIAPLKVVRAESEEDVKMKVDKNKFVEETKPQTGTIIAAFNFDFNAEGTKVSKEEAITELRKAADLLQYLQASTVSFKVEVGN